MTPDTRSYNISSKIFSSSRSLCASAFSEGQIEELPRLFFQSRQKREQQARNRAKARALINQHGDDALNYVRAQIAATAWEIRAQAHWQRIEKHVKSLLRR
jgi:hypothetical protein